MPVFVDISGRVFGRFRVLDRDVNSPRGQTRWRCLCDCGKTVSVRADTLKSGGSKSCGCFSKELRTIDGASDNGVMTPEYRSWHGMKDRCLNPNYPRYDRYGGRGISICDRWVCSFKAFLDDMGKRPSAKYSLDRKNNNGNYDPGNCRWATRLQQVENRSVTVWITVNDETFTASDWSRRLGGCHALVYSRIHAGWTEAQAVLTPVGQRRAKNSTS